MNIWRTFYLVLFLQFNIVSSSLAEESAPSYAFLALKQIREGNKRFQNNQSFHYQSDKNLNFSRSNLPIALIIACSDSQISPNVLFDQPLGQLAIMQVKGNAIGPKEKKNLEFYLQKTPVPLILVLGHHDCKAIKTALNTNKKTKFLRGSKQLTFTALQEAALKPGDPLINAIKENVKFSMKNLQESPLLEKLIRSDQLKILGGYYDAKTKEVEIFP